MSTLAPQLIVEGTLWALLGFSLLTWTVIIAKTLQYIGVSVRDKRYAERFWQASHLGKAAQIEVARAPLHKIARAGFDALSIRTTTSATLRDGGNRERLLERSLRHQLQTERRSLENGLSMLASIGSTAPFVGLFGTVIGIMRALQDIGNSGSVSFDVVAGPIGEALLATGIGIAVAVPAVLAYNFFLRRSKQIALRLEDFATDFMSLAQEVNFLSDRAESIKCEAITQSEAANSESVNSADKAVAATRSVVHPSIAIQPTLDIAR